MEDEAKEIDNSSEKINIEEIKTEDINKDISNQENKKEDLKEKELEIKEENIPKPELVEEHLDVKADDKNEIENKDISMERDFVIIVN